MLIGVMVLVGGTIEVDLGVRLYHLSTHAFLTIHVELSPGRPLDRLLVSQGQLPLHVAFLVKFVLSE